jgi:hypothetical protein
MARGLMKNQYFGDTRDLFKYDLVLELLCKTDLDRFTFVPMLTPDDDSGHGGRTDYRRAKAGRDNQELKDYLATCVAQDRRDVSETAGIFRVPKWSAFELLMYDRPFSDDDRLQFWTGLPEESLKEAVIVLDPDNGLWVKSSRLRGEKYVRYDEVRHVHDSMDARSVLVIFQYIPRVNRITFCNDVSMQLKDIVTDGRPVI